MPISVPFRPFTLAVAIVAIASGCSAPTGGRDLLGNPMDQLGKADGDTDGRVMEGVLDTALSLDLSARRGRAVLMVAPSDAIALDVGDLDIDGATVDGEPLAFDVGEGGKLTAALPESDVPIEVAFDYAFHDRAETDFSGYIPDSNVTFLWPYFCGNLFPCVSGPSDGTRFTVDVTGVPDGVTAVYPHRIANDAPAYMVAIAVGDYLYEELGTTSAGTRVGVYYLPRGMTRARRGTRELVRAFDLLESTYGAYAFGDDVASVAVRWGEGAVGGMEHHPYWHVATDAMDDTVTHVHEAAHGWYGDGVRIACWEDFVLSEGTTSYLAARTIGRIRGPSRVHEVWDDYRADLDDAVATGDTEAWPEGECDSIDLLHHPVWSNIPYMKGAFFLRAVAEEIGEETLDEVLARFYAAHVGQRAGSVRGLLDAIAETGFDPSPLADSWLRGRGNPLAP